MEGFITHCGASEVTRAEVLAVDMPQHTRSYQPVSYSQLLDYVEGQIKQLGFPIISSAFALNRGGKHMFAKWILDVTETPEHGLSIVCRQSINKQFKLAVAGGVNTFVCDNQSISGAAFTSMKKNTPNGWNNFRMTMLDQLDAFHTAYHGEVRELQSWDDITVSEDEGYRELGYMIGKGKIKPVPFGEALREWRKPTHEEQAARTLGNLYNAVTAGLKKTPQAALPENSIAAHQHFRDLYLQG